MLTAEFLVFFPFEDIRRSEDYGAWLGIAWDPITGNLWDTENGPHFGDEINLVELGFNSGWVKIQGVWKPRFDERGELSLNPTGLVSFGGRGKYNEPQFTWIPTVAPTAMCIRITIHPCRQRIEIGFWQIPE